MVPRDVFSMSKAARIVGREKDSKLLGLSPTSDWVHWDWFEINGLEITVRCTIKTIYKTGVEVEAMRVSVVALNMYDMLKPIDKGVEIRHIKLLKKRRKSDYSDTFNKGLIGSGHCMFRFHFGRKKEDYAGKGSNGKIGILWGSCKDYQIIPDEKELIQEKAKHYHQEGIDLIIFSGGTGLSHRDVTPSTTASSGTKESRIEEAIRSYGQDHTPYSMLSRSGRVHWARAFTGSLPGSTKGAQESMDALFPALLHIFRIFQGAKHDSWTRIKTYSLILLVEPLGICVFPDWTLQFAYVPYCMPAEGIPLSLNPILWVMKRFILLQNLCGLWGFKIRITGVNLWYVRISRWF